MTINLKSMHVKKCSEYWVYRRFRGSLVPQRLIKFRNRDF